MNFICTLYNSYNYIYILSCLFDKILHSCRQSTKYQKYLKNGEHICDDGIRVMQTRNSSRCSFAGAVSVPVT